MSNIYEKSSKGSQRGVNTTIVLQRSHILQEVVKYQPNIERDKVAYCNPKSRGSQPQHN